MASLHDDDNDAIQADGMFVRICSVLNYYAAKQRVYGCRQLGFVNFEPLKPMFLDVSTGSHGALPTLPHLGPLAVALDRNWSSGDSVKPPQAPALVSHPAASPSLSSVIHYLSNTDA